eukprot:460019_1
MDKHYQSTYILIVRSAIFIDFLRNCNSTRITPFYNSRCFHHVFEILQKLLNNIMVLLALLFLQLLTNVHSTVINVNDYGAIPTINTVDSAFNNSAAFTTAFNALASNPNATTLIFPASYTYYMYPIQITALKNKTIIIDSLIYANDDIESYPHSPNTSTSHGKYYNLFEFNNISNINFTGYGKIDGQGYKWWSLFLINDIPYERPKLFETNYAINIIIQNIELSNSPSFHLHLIESTNLLVENVTVWANTTQQQQLLIDNNKWDFKQNIPMFPFNTDGIDVTGKDIIVRNCSVHNYDDRVCVKPCQLKRWGCTTNVLVENTIQIGGAGMSVGSLSPSDGINCIENVVFRNIIFESPLKAIYIKTNSGNEGTGRIYNITYENIYMYQNPDLFPQHAFLWPIYIGPQQQKEPNGDGDGCFIDFIRCPTQPRVNLTNIYLTNVTAVNSIFTNPAVLNCNYTNPCTEFIFNDVKFLNSTIYDPWDELYLCRNVYGEFNQCEPKPICRNITL